MGIFKNLFSIKGFKLEEFASKSFTMKEGFSRFKENAKDLPLSVSEFTKSVKSFAKDSYQKFRNDISKGAVTIARLCKDEAKKLMDKEDVGLEMGSNVRTVAENSVGLASKGETEKDAENKKRNDDVER